MPKQISNREAYLRASALNRRATEKWIAFGEATRGNFSEARMEHYDKLERKSARACDRMLSLQAAYLADIDAIIARIKPSTGR